MNYYELLPPDIILHIDVFVKYSYVNYIIAKWRRYYSYKCFIYYSVKNLPKFRSIFHDFNIYFVNNKHTYFYFKKLKQLITGRETYINSIYLLYYQLARSIDDYEWAWNGYGSRFFHYLNRNICITVANKFKWDSIIELLVDD